jgi:hypothetical protein
MLPKLLRRPGVRRLLGLALTVQGIVGAVAPRTTIKLNARLWLREAFENPDDLEPTDAYAGLVRDASLAAILLGVLTLRRAAQDEATETAERMLSEAADADAAADDAASDADADA